MHEAQKVDLRPILRDFTNKTLRTFYTMHAYLNLFLLFAAFGLAGGVGEQRSSEALQVFSSPE